MDLFTVEMGGQGSTSSHTLHFGHPLHRNNMPQRTSNSSNHSHLTPHTDIIAIQTGRQGAVFTVSKQINNDVVAHTSQSGPSVWDTPVSCGQLR